jgi:hypothetical protein
MAAYIPYQNQRGHNKFEKFVMAGIHLDNAEYSRMLEMGVETMDLQRAAHLLHDASSAAAKDREDQVVAKVLADARRHQKNKGFKQVVGLCNGSSVSTNVEDVIESDKNDDEVAIIIEGDDCDGLDGDDLDGSGLSGGYGNENARCLRATYLAAQPSACGLRGGYVARCVAKRVLLEQTIANSVAKKPDGNHWFGKGKKPKKAQHQDTQERMDNLIEEMVGEGSLMRQAIKDLTARHADDNPMMTKEKETSLSSATICKNFLR